MVGLAGAYAATIAQVKASTNMSLSRSVIAKDRPSVADMRRKFSIEMPTASATIDRDAMVCSQRIVVWFVWPINGGKHDASVGSALTTEQRLINGLRDRAWHDLPVEWCEYVSSVRFVSPDGELYKIGVTADLMVYWDPDEVVS